MGKLTNLNPPAPIADTDLPASIARDTEYIAADTAHLNATDPHLQYATQARSDARYLRSDVPPPQYGSLVVPGSKSNYAGVHFSGGFNAPTLMINANSWQHGMWSAGAAAGWLWQYNNGWIRVFNPHSPTPTQTSRGVYIGFEKAFGSLPGYPNDDFPTIRTDFSTLYFSIGNAYSGHITTGGTYVAVSDREKKKNEIEVDYSNILQKLKRIPIYEYSFVSESERVRRLGPFSQDFYEAFKLGGEIEPDSPNSPDKLLAPSDAIGVLLAAVRALAEEVEVLRISRK